MHTYSYRYYISCMRTMHIKRLTMNVIHSLRNKMDNGAWYKGAEFQWKECIICTHTTHTCVCARTHIHTR